MNIFKSFVLQWKFGDVSSSSLLYQTFLYSVMLVLCLKIFTTYPIDHYIQDIFFNFDQNQWLVSKENMPLRAIFYYGAKYAVAAFGLVLIGLFIKDRRNEKRLDKAAILFVVSCLIAIPSLAAFLKYLTGIPCPYLLKDYGGMFDYSNIMTPHWPDGSARPKCFPAGHPSGGLALLAVAYVANNKRKIIFIALFMGLIMSLYQIARGAHFVSHCLVSLFLSLIVINLIYLIFSKFVRKN